VSEFENRTGVKPCPRCKAPMQEVLRIAPAQNDPGLIAYECPSCGYVTSDLMANTHPPGK
jgi:transposase-like protein